MEAYGSLYELPRWETPPAVPDLHTGLCSTGPACSMLPYESPINCVHLQNRYTVVAQPGGSGEARKPKERGAEQCRS